MSQKNFALSSFISRFRRFRSRKSIQKILVISPHLTPFMDEALKIEYQFLETETFNDRFSLIFWSHSLSRTLSNWILAIFQIKVWNISEKGSQNDVKFRVVLSRFWLEVPLLYSSFIFFLVSSFIRYYCCYYYYFSFHTYFSQQEVEIKDFFSCCFVQIYNKRFFISILFR